MRFSWQVTQPGAFCTSFTFPLFRNEQRLLAVGQAGASPNLASVWAGVSGDPYPATCGPMNAGFLDGRLGWRSVAQQSPDDPLGQVSTDFLGLRPSPQRKIYELRYAHHI
jgi:hypothetical protein